MLNIERALANKRLMLAITGVTPQEFQSLIPVFSQSYFEEKQKQHQKNAKERELGGGRIGFLKTIPEKLFFVLFYYKCYPTYDVLSFVYECNRSNACRRQFQLSDVIEKALGRKMVLPERQMRKLEEFFQAFPEAREVFIDGTERPIQRPKDKERQKANYSGKKKKHTRKNLVITEKNKRVGFLSKTVEGKKHDFVLLKEEAPPEHMPPKKKKPKNKELTKFAKEQNTKKSAVRVLVENALAGVKRIRITTDTFRNRKKNFDDQTMLIACGLWNYHLTMKC